jgi:hypothetical protein
MQVAPSAIILRAAWTPPWSSEALSSLTSSTVCSAPAFLIAALISSSASSPAF